MFRPEDVPLGVFAGFLLQFLLIPVTYLVIQAVFGEIQPSAEFYDYDAKYVDGTSKLLIPAPLDAETARATRAMAVAAYRALRLLAA